MCSAESEPPGTPGAGQRVEEGMPTLDGAEQRRLLEIARASITDGLTTGVPLKIALEQECAALRHQRASFVTLQINQALRGCIGHLEAVVPLATDVAENAFAAAFRDPRFRPLSQRELDRIHIEVSVLTPPEPIAFSSETELLAALVPHRDGLILTEGPYQGTFLPSVWAQLPTPEAFLNQLKRKAGLPADHWSDAIRVARYRTESFAE